jgi:hypothetical protein
MPIRPVLIDFVRTFVRNDFEAGDRIEQQLAEEGWGKEWASFLSAVFFYAVDLHFDGKRDDAAMIRFVAEMRADTAGSDVEIDPVAAEALLTSVFDPSIEIKVAPEMLGAIQTSAIYKTLSRPEVSDAELEALLARAVRLADG